LFSHFTRCTRERWVLFTKQKTFKRVGNYKKEMCEKRKQKKTFLFFIFSKKKNNDVIYTHAHTQTHIQWQGCFIFFPERQR
jgi:hypothetical protein